MKTGCYLTVKGKEGQHWVEEGWGPQLGVGAWQNDEVDVDEEEMLVPCQLLV